ncbi:MAG: tRNA pseudouridine(38-40) synthase TruA [Cyclobacteriaceae bacterium]
MRYFFEISYKGSSYHGWQSQKNALGVQAVVEEKLHKLFRREISIVGSGRTDTGVHCMQQYFHLDIDKELDYAETLQRLNSFLPSDIAIHSIRRVKDEAHARYMATERTYEYRITQVKNPFTHEFAYHYFRPLDVITMNRAATLLVGEQDFQSFSKVKTDVNHFICDIRKAEWNQKGGLLVFTITANRFLRGMVRAIVGSLVDVGSGKTSLKSFQKIVSSKDRKQAGMNVPPEGLFLMNVKYPRSIFLD